MRHPILFTGHMIDNAKREQPRFPKDKEKPVTDEMMKQLSEVFATTKNSLIGIASGACGGDIIFHELCERAGIPSEIFLPLPIEEFKKESVSFAGTDWEARFHRLIKKLPVHLLPAEKSNSSVNVWAATNEWMIESAQKINSNEMTLLALWDGKGGDGEGGTEHMINMAKKKGAKINIIRINEI